MLVSAKERVILLADDSPDDTVFFNRALLAAGFENPLFTVPNGEEAESYLQGEGQYADRAHYPLPYLLVLDATLNVQRVYLAGQYLKDCTV